MANDVGLKISQDNLKKKKTNPHEIVKSSPYDKKKLKFNSH